MRLLHSVLPMSSQTKKPQRKFIAHLLGLLLMLPGHATFRNMSRYSSYHEKTLSRWYERPFDWVALNKAAITPGIPPEHEQALVIEASFIPKSGKQTYGLARLWNGCHSRAEKGLELSTVAWLDITDNCAYCVFHGFLPPNPWEGCHSIHVKAGSWPLSVMRWDALQASRYCYAPSRAHAYGILRGCPGCRA